MAESKQETVTLPVPAGLTADQMMVAFAAMGQQIASSVASGIAEARPQKQPYGQFVGKSPFHADHRKVKKLTRPVYQNGTRLFAPKLHVEEIESFNKIVRPGRYINRLIEVILRQEGSDEVLELRYKNKTADDRMEHKSAYRDLREMLRLILAEQDEKLAEETVLKEARKAFSTEATRIARAKAAERAAGQQSLEP